MKPEIIEDREWTRKLRLADGRVVQLTLDHAREWLDIQNEEGTKIGRFEFEQIDDEDEYYYKIVWMYLDLKDDSYKRKGIGKAALEFFNDGADAYLVVEKNDGKTRDDGSHLTGDVPGFVAAMVSHGVIHRCGESGRRSICDELDGRTEDE